MAQSQLLTAAEMPQPRKPTAYMDNEQRIWLFEPDRDDPLRGQWRAPGGLVCRKGNKMLDTVLARLGVTKLRRMAPVRISST